MIWFDQELDRQRAAADFIVQHEVLSAGDARCLLVFFPHLTELIVEEVTDRGAYVLLASITCHHQRLPVPALVRPEECC